MVNVFDNDVGKSDLTDMFEDMGYEISWDFSKYDGLHWHEIINSKTGKMALQVEFGVTKEKFLKEWFDDSVDYPSFFIGVDKNQKEFELISERITNYKSTFNRGT